MTDRRSSPSRLRRNDDDPLPPFRLTEDDITILWHVYRNRLIDSQSIYRLFAHRSEQQLSRRLNALFRHHYIGRPTRQIELVTPGSGSEHLVYGLDREGARLLAERFGVRINHYHWLQKNAELTRTNIGHTLSTTRFMINLEVSARKHGRVRVIPFDELLATYAPSHTKRLPRPGYVRAGVNWNGHSGEEGTIPDRIFGLEYLDRPVESRKVFFYLEIDEGFETVEPSGEQQKAPSFFRRSSILRKFIVYAFAYRARFHEKHFGFFAPPRMMVVTTSPDRIATMQAAYIRHIAPQPLGLQPGMALFAHGRGIEDAQSLLEMPWRSATGRETWIDGRIVT